MNKRLQSTKGSQGPTISLARHTAFKILLRVESGAYASVLLAAKAESLKPTDRGLCYELVLGVLRHQLWLDYIIEYYSKRRAKSLDPEVRIALRLGLYQLRFLTRVPHSAAVNESVKLVRSSGVASASGFVNAVLRRATRENDYDPVAEIADPVERLAVESSHPEWLVSKWVSAYGSSQAEAIAKSNNEAAPNAFRVVTSKASEAEVVDRLKQSGSQVSPSFIVEGSWRIDRVSDLLLQLARDGFVYIQDEASQLVGKMLGAQQGDLVLDLCAGPGGKTTMIAESMSDSGLVVATDLYPHRLRTVMFNSKAQGLRNVVAVTADGRGPLSFLEASFDRVLVDAPCSGTGTLRRNPEIRWRISGEDFRDLSILQEQLLLSAARMLKPGGRLVYSTCSLEPEENEEVVDRFRASNSEFEAVQLPLNPQLLTPSGAARTWPHRDGVDGFFVAAFERK